VTLIGNGVWRRHHTRMHKDVLVLQFAKLRCISFVVC
jgi:hypothetical protein